MNIFSKVMRIVKKVNAILIALPIIIKLIAILSLVVFASTLFANLYETITAKNTPTKIYEELGIAENQDISELIEIKGNSQTGYYLDFVDDIDIKLEALIETLNTSGAYHNVPEDVEFLKKLLKAEAITKFPDLGGEIPEGESGFQGAIDIKRATPNKEVGEMKNTGKGDTSTLETETSYSETTITPKEEEIKNWEEGKRLFLNKRAYVYDESANIWTKREENGKYIIIEMEDEVVYSGNYEKVEDKLNNTVTFYIEVNTGDVKGHIQSKDIDIFATNYSTEENESPEEEISLDDIEVTSRDTTTDREKETVGEEGKTYTVAIAAGHNNSNNLGARANGLIEEELTIKVAEKVEELINEQYENIVVKQTGSTTENPGGIQVSERTELARNVNPDLCIQIHFNASDSAEANGVEVIYKEGDGYSQQLAEILTKSISSAMGLEDRGAGPDTEKCAVGSLGIIENYASSGFPSVVTEGGFLSGNIDSEVIKNGGVETYAQGIVNGIKTYLETDHTGLTATEQGTTTITTSIESRVVNMKYVTPEEFENLKTSGNVKEAIKYFTLNEENKLLTLTWVQSENGDIEIKENAAMDFRTSLQQYHMPFEYLLYYYIDTGYQEFSEQLADIVIESEIVIALQDNITTTQTIKDTQVKVEPLSEEAKQFDVYHDWEIDDSSHTETITEVCTTKIDITYIETWCVKTYKDNSFSNKVLNMGDQDEIIVNIAGQVTKIDGENEIGEEKQVGTTSINSGRTDENGDPIKYSYAVKHRTVTVINTLMSRYNTDGDAKVEAVTNKYVDLYIKEHMNERMQEGWFFKIVQNNEKTANLLDLTKYLMFLASRTNYGVTEYDFDIFDLDNFKTISGSGSQMDLLIEYIHYFEHSTPPPTNADGTKYIIENDGAGNAVVGYGVDIFNGGFAEEFRQAGYPTEIGAEVDKEFVDNLEKREIQECIDSIKSITSGLNLTGYQINALVSRAYNCGVAGAVSKERGSPSMNFVNSYNTYWRETDDQYEERNSNANFNHNLYEQYMCKPVTASGQYLRGLEIRRKSEWTLFQTGYYDVLDKWHTEGMGGTILECAKTIHEYMEQKGYTYCAYGGNNAEECGIYGKKHGLNSTFEESKTGYQNTCCATYVSWVLQEAGYLTREEHQNGANNLTNLLIKKGFIIIRNTSELLPGDILSYNRHVEIYAGDGQVYNAGNGKAIRSASPYNKDVSKMNIALRAPN